MSTPVSYILERIAAAGIAYRDNEVGSRESLIELSRDLILKPALEAGYSRVLLDEIVLSEEQPTIAATSMDMMTMAPLGVRERTEADWKEILVRAGLRFMRTYNYPGVAESVIEAELL